MAKCVVSGGAGLIGSHLAKELLNQGHEVLIIDDLTTGSRYNIPNDSIFIESPLENITTETIRGADVIFHLASISGEAVSFFSPTANFKRNVDAGYYLLMRALDAGIKRFVFTSSMAVYGNSLYPPFSEEDLTNPTDPYGLSKFTIEKLLRFYGEISDTNWTILRLHNVFGPGINISDPYRGVIGNFLVRALTNKPLIIYGDGTQSRAFTYVSDIISPIITAGFSERCNNQIINLGSKTPVSINNLVKLIKEITSKEVRTIYLESRLGEAHNAYTTYQKAVQLLEFEDKTTLLDGLSATLNWIKEIEFDDFDYSIVDLEVRNLENYLPDSWRNPARY